MPITNAKAVKLCAEMINYHNIENREPHTLIVSRKIYRKVKRYNFLHIRNKFEPEGIRIIKVR